MLRYFFQDFGLDNGVSAPLGRRHAAKVWPRWDVCTKEALLFVEHESRLREKWRHPEKFLDLLQNVHGLGREPLPVQDQDPVRVELVVQRYQMLAVVPAVDQRRRGLDLSGLLVKDGVRETAGDGVAPPVLRRRTVWSWRRKIWAWSRGVWSPRRHALQIGRKMTIILTCSDLDEIHNIVINSLIILCQWRTGGGGGAQLVQRVP